MLWEGFDLSAIGIPWPCYRGHLGLRAQSWKKSLKMTQRAQRLKRFDPDRNLWSRSKFLISLENFNLDVSISPQKNRAAVGGSLENFILARNFQSRSKSRIFLIFGPSGEFPGPLGPAAQKVENGVEKESKLTVFQLFWLFFDSGFDFLGPGAERPRELIFGLFFQLWARRAQMTPVAGKSFRNLARDNRCDCNLWFWCAQLEAVEQQHVPGWGTCVACLWCLRYRWRSRKSKVPPFLGITPFL